MNPELARELNALFDAAAQSRPSSDEFELACRNGGEDTGAQQQ